MSVKKNYVCLHFKEMMNVSGIDKKTKTLDLVLALDG